MKIRGNTAGTPMLRPDWKQNNPKKSDYIKNKPEKLLQGTDETLSIPGMAADAKVTGETFCKKNPQYTATPNTLLELIGKAEAGTTVQLTAGEYSLLELVGINAYPEDLTIVGCDGVEMAGVSITSGVKDQDINSVYQNNEKRHCTNADVSNAIMPAGLTFKNIAFTDSFCLRNCGLDRLSIINCTFVENAYVNIEPNRMKNVYGVDRTGSSFNFETRRTYARIIPKDLLIRDCTFEGTTGTEQSADGDACIHIKGVDGVVIYRNIIKKASFSGITVGGVSNKQYGIYSTGRISITNNTISNTSQRGINLYDIKDGEVTVAANLLENVNLGHSHQEQIIAQNCIDTSFAWNGKIGTDSFYNYYTDDETEKKKLYVDDGITLSNCNNPLEDHIADESNPHGVTAEQIGAASAAEIGSVKETFPVGIGWMSEPDESGLMYGMITISAVWNENTHLLGKTLCVKTYAYGDMAYCVDECGGEEESVTIATRKVNPGADIANNPESGVCEFEIVVPEGYKTSNPQIDICIPFVENPYTELEIYEKKGTVWEEIKKVSNNSIIASGCGYGYYWRKWGDGFAECWVEFGGDVAYMEDAVVEMYVTLPVDFCIDIPPKVIANIVGNNTDDNGMMPYSALEIWGTPMFVNPREFSVYLQAPHTGITSAGGTIYVTGYWKYVEEEMG